MKKLGILAFSFCVGIQLLGCAQGSLAPDVSTGGAEVSAEDQADYSYLLSAGDTVTINVYGEDELSGTYKINGDGFVSFPLIGIVKIDTLSVYEAKALIEMRLKEGYLRDPSVSIDIAEYRPFSILGEVTQAGNYDYTEGLIVADAIALAGGFTYRAQQGTVEVLRRTHDGWKRFNIRVSSPIFPGDVIYVRERLF